MTQFKLLLIAVIGLRSICGTSIGGNKIVCYFDSWAYYRVGDGKCGPSDINPFLCTHVIYTFLGLGPTTSKVISLDPWLDEKSGLGLIPKIVGLKKENPRLKCMFAAGGWNEGSTKYSQMAADPKKRAIFVASVVDVSLKYGFDGFDLDWEYPCQRGGTSADKRNFVLLLKELKQALHRLGMLLSVALGAGKSTIEQSYDIPGISNTVDFMNLMSYDYAGYYDNFLGCNAPLRGQGDRSVESSTEMLLELGADPSKLILGVASYGRTFRLPSSQKPYLGCRTIGPGEMGRHTRESGYMAYSEICECAKNLSHIWLPDQGVPLAYNGQDAMSYDNKESIILKVRYALSKKLGGMMMWTICSEDIKGKCGEKYPLLKAINNELRNGTTEKKLPQEPEPSFPKKPEPSFPKVPKPSEPTQPREAVDCSTDGLFRNPNNCAGFLQCANGVAYYKDCPSDLLFDPRAGVCNYKDQVDCPEY